MKKYRVDCWERQTATVQVGDKVHVWGKTSALINYKLIKAERIKNNSRPSAPICKCGEPQMPTEKTIAKDSDIERLDIEKIFTRDIEVEGVVTYVEETKVGFWFNMESEE